MAQDHRGDAGRGDGLAARPHGGRSAGRAGARARADDEWVAVPAADRSRGTLCGQAGGPHTAGLSRAGLIPVIPEAAKRLSGIHNHKPLASAPFVVMDSGLAPEPVIGPAGGRTRWAPPE